MAKCSFCSRDMVKGTGKLLILNNGKLLYFCSSKCEKNTKLKRKPQRITWARKRREATRIVKK